LISLIGRLIASPILSYHNTIDTNDTNDTNDTIAVTIDTIDTIDINGCINGHIKCSR